VQSARAAVVRAEAAALSAQLTARRIGELARIDAVSAQDNENAIATLRQAEADVEVAKAALEVSLVVLGHARIVAPITGRIGKSAVTQGALVTANQAAPLATIQQLDPIFVDLTLASSELLHLRKELQAGTLTSGRDLPVTILLEDGSPHSQSGKFAFADLSVDPATGSFLVRIEVPNPGNLLLPGMYVRAEISMGQRADALLVPQTGITRTAKGDASALLVGVDGKVEQRSVQVTRTIGDRWLVESGLAAGERVIVEGLQRVQPGAMVEASEAVVVGAAGEPAAAPTPAPAAAPAEAAPAKS
jgi:membrane fusion protein (multidrug efflux system)